MTQPVYDPAVLLRFLDDVAPLDLPVLVGLLPLASHRNAEFLHNEVPGMQVPEGVRERMRKAGSGAGGAQGGGRDRPRDARGRTLARCGRLRHAAVRTLRARARGDRRLPGPDDGAPSRVARRLSCAAWSWRRRPATSGRRASRRMRRPARSRRRAATTPRAPGRQSALRRATEPRGGRSARRRRRALRRRGGPRRRRVRGRRRAPLARAAEARVASCALGGDAAAPSSISARRSATRLPPRSSSARGRLYAVAYVAAERRLSRRRSRAAPSR